MSDPDFVYLDTPPPTGRRITELHVWIAIYPDGSEGIVSADLPMPNGLGHRHMPLMNSSRASAEAAEPIARRVQRHAMHSSMRIVKLKLVTFRVSADG
jgi:hypothetical protein